MTDLSRTEKLFLAAAIASLFAWGAVLAFGAGDADAHKRTYASEVQLKAKAASDTTLTLDGKVTSDNSRCVAGREVTITANGAFVASATTLVNGEYSVLSSTRPVKGTTLIATISRKFLKRSKKHRHKCASDFSERRAP
jgi:hypothetical protein